jgi:peptidoglycan/LPS O-acetylase OafA/YrhL
MILATCLFFVFETSAVLQVVFGNIVMRLLGKLAPGIYLLAPAITYTVVPTLGISLRNNGSSGSAVLGVTWVVCFAICVVAAIPFHFLVELPSKLAGEYFADFVEKWGRSKDELAAPAANGGKVQVKGPQKSAPKKLSGPGAK